MSGYFLLIWQVLFLSSNLRAHLIVGVINFLCLWVGGGCGVHVRVVCLCLLWKVVYWSSPAIHIRMAGHVSWGSCLSTHGLPTDQLWTGLWVALFPGSLGMRLVCELHTHYKTWQTKNDWNLGVFIFSHMISQNCYKYTISIIKM